MKKKAIYLGHHQDDIYTILAREEAMHQIVADWGVPLLMTCEIKHPAVTIAEREDIKDIRVEECIKDGIDFTRRLGSGSVIWLDNRMLAYFLVIPKEKHFKNLEGGFKFHRNTARKIALALKGLGISEIYVGEKFSISLQPSPNGVISGNAVSIKGGVLAYHGVLVLDKLNLEAIKKYIVLRKNERVDEEKLLAQLPSLNQATGKKYKAKEVAIVLVREVADGEYRSAAPDETKQLEVLAESFMEKYKSHSWIFNPPLIIDKNAGFCLIALSEEWKERNFSQV